LPRRLERVSLLHALVYHEREQLERAELHEHIEQSVQTDQHRQEVRSMRKTIADSLKEEGRLEKSRETLLRQLQLRFGALAPEISAAIQACSEESQLNIWLDAFATARRLADVGIE